MKVKFKGKGFKIFALILSCALFVTSLAVTTFSRFVSLVNAPFEGKEHLNYTVNTVFIARNQEELFAAINQGYTYIQLDKNIENPLIITQKTENLDTDLILDLNGIEIQRNGYDPILNVKENVRLTIIDTSDEQTGGLYNPVGSVFNVNGRDGKGGTLTILAGKFESGPRYSEYYSYNDFILNDSQNSLTQRTKVEADPQLVTMHVRKESGNGFNEITTEYRAPIIKSYPEKTGEITYEHGNLYFDTTITKGDLTINPDTYCYYRTSENYALDSSEIAQSDWYYTYYVHPETFNYVGATVDESEVDNFVKITIYGYENVIKQAAEHSDPVAALRMTLGTIDIQDGGFYSYFGVKNAACVNAVGGNIKIKTARFSSRVPNATSAVADSVSVKEDDESAFQIDNYFNNYKWSTDADGAVPSGNLARKGEAYCILNGGNATVDIDKGDFYSSNNNIVGMEGGSLSVGGGTFTKQLTNGIKTNEIRDLSAIYMASGSLDISNATCSVLADNVHASNAIYMLAGELTVNNTNYIISGNSTTGIRMLDGQLSVSGGSCSISGDNTYGIYSTVSGDDKFYVKNTSFELTAGNNQTAIFTQNGRINISADTSSTISTSGANGKGIHVASGGSVISENYSYTLSGNDSHGIYSTAGTIDVSGGNLTLTGARSYGIYSTAGSITMEGGDIELSGITSYGIYATSGTIALTDGNVSLTGNTSYGIYSTAGAITVSGGNVDLSGASSYGIYATGGSISLANGDITLEGSSSYGIYSTAESITVEKGNVSLEGANSYGIYSGAGSVTMDGGNVTLSSNVSCYGIYAESTNNSTLDVRLNEVNTSVGYTSTNQKTSGTVKSSIGVFMATTNPNNIVELTNSNIYCYEVGVALSGGKLNVLGSGEIKTKKASAIVVMGGDLTFESESSYTVESFATTNAQTNNIYNITLPLLNGNTITDTAYDNADGLYVSNGRFTSNGGLALTHTGLRNSTDYNNYTGLVIRSYAVRVVGGSVLVYKGEITALAGGGIYCSSGDITMGNEDTQNTDITVKANGRLTNDQEYHAIISNQGSWQNEKSLTGGNAIELAGGNITIHSGFYEAQFGNGIAANSSGSIYIYDGEFYGWMNDSDNDMTPNYNNSGVRKSGPSAFYGLKVIGGATVNIYGGIYDGGNGGAFVTGIDKNSITFNRNGPTALNTTGKNRATVYIYAGTFGGSGKGALALDGFNVYDYSNIIFGAYTATTSPYQTANEYLNAIKINAQNATIATNPITNSSLRASSNVYVYYGDYDSGNSGVWNDNANTIFYNTRTTIGYTQTKGGGTVQNNANVILFDGTI